MSHVWTGRFFFLSFFTSLSFLQFCCSLLWRRDSKSGAGFPQSWGHCISSQVGSLPAPSTFDNLINCCARKNRPRSQTCGCQRAQWFHWHSSVTKMCGHPARPCEDRSGRCSTYNQLHFGGVWRWRYLRKCRKNPAWLLTWFKVTFKVL